jgi:DNA modification methylase
VLIWHYPNGVNLKGPDGFKETYDPIFFYRRIGSGREIQIPTTDWNQGLNRFDCHVAAVPQGNYGGENFKQHISQKPTSALRWLVAATTKPGEMVADPFCGSGTTEIAACQLGRRFHGSVNRPEDMSHSRERLSLHSNAQGFELG